ncbi:flagellar hook assembly protein FlgD [Salisediminibacterium beveridgei]|uniref:Flagellar basal-body rod modification protein FlgD n=1 Tax=Salisediminibacterium beveridgei TaxID=632773 RepID=A0A1D7QW01_9BACI|nr:flagellar hook assembly protein FlgD [Salisediminibacterium beveridgei]AOM83183.1 Flagellar basal-body rod modification protein FlgD [Salisediminibacterium beveridgei]
MPINPTGNSNSLFYEDFVKEQEAKGTGNQDMGKDAFLKLLITQLQNQDPLEPMEDKEFIAQMANFTSLEQMTNMNENMSKFIENQQQGQFFSHSDMIGKSVEWQEEVETEDGNKRMETMEAIVQAVKFKNGAATILTRSGEELSVDDIQKIAQPEEGEANT